MASELPPYEEQIQVASMDTDEGVHGLSQASAYRILATDLKRALLKAIERGSARLLSTYLQALLAYPEGCTRGESVFDPDTGDLIVQLPPLDAERVYPKEQQLIDLVAQERLAGRRVLVYATHTGTRDITGRLETLLTRHGFRVAVMKADKVEPKRREAWVAKRVEEGVDVLICHPRLVQTGLDLIAFATVAWYETDYSVYTMRQASRRSWRIGQHRPVKVVFMAYRHTLQADALKLVAQKLQSSLAVEGDLPEDGLAAYGDTGDDLMMALARKLVSGETDSEPVEDIFRQAQQVAAEADQLLVDADWNEWSRQRSRWSCRLRRMAMLSRSSNWCLAAVTTARVSCSNRCSAGPSPGRAAGTGEVARTQPATDGAFAVRLGPGTRAGGRTRRRRLSGPHPTEEVIAQTAMASSGPICVVVSAFKANKL